MTYGFHLIFHEEHDGDIRFSLASDFYSEKMHKNST